MLEQILDEIRRDVTSFSDPGTTVDLGPSGTLRWTRSRKEMSATLVRQSPTTFPAIRWQGRIYGYPSFLASEAMADLKDLAEAIVSQVEAPSNFVPMHAKWAGTQEDSSSSEDAVELLRRESVEMDRRPLLATRVLFLYGNAGVGKTSTLAQLAHQQAERYLLGDTSTLFLYIDAQGKGLSQLEDVMARALQDLRAKFTYHCVATLARRNCIVPIVDGLDELIGPSNAREALSNLALFLAQLDREGALITSSRSAFIDYRTLFERSAELAAARGLSYEIAPVEILPWSRESALQYAEQRLSKDLVGRIEQLLESPPAQSLVRKPFYLVRICDILVSGGDVNEQDDLGRQIVSAALIREHGKLKDSRGNPLLTLEQHRGFCQMLADEMWCQERIDLDSDSIRLLAELFAEEIGLPSREAKILIDRSIAHGLLVAVPNQDRRAFEHELFRFEFLSGRLASVLRATGAEIHDFCGRAEIPQEVLSRLQHVSDWRPEEVGSVCVKLHEARAVASKNPFVPSNGGAILTALARDRSDLPGRLRLGFFIFRADSFGSAVLREASFNHALLERMDLCATKLLDCDTVDAVFLNCTVSDDTHFNGTHVNPAAWPGLIEFASHEQEHFEPAEIAEILGRHGAVLPTEFSATPPPLSSRANEAMALAERFLDRARARYYFSHQDTWVRRKLDGNPVWTGVEQLLRKHHLLADRVISKSGPSETFFCLTTPPDLILQAKTDPTRNPSAAEFWNDVRQL